MCPVPDCKSKAFERRHNLLRHTWTHIQTKYYIWLICRHCHRREFKNFSAIFHHRTTRCMTTCNTCKKERLPSRHHTSKCVKISIEHLQIFQMTADCYDVPASIVGFLPELADEFIWIAEHYGIIMKPRKNQYNRNCNLLSN